MLPIAGWVLSRRCKMDEVDFSLTAQGFLVCIMRITFHFKRSLAVAIFSLVTGVMVCSAYSDITYTVTAIDTLGGDRNFANDISDTGFVTGNSRKVGSSQLIPYVWRAGVVEEIPILSGVPTFGRGFSVNDAGVVAGESGNGPSKAFRYDSVTNSIVDLGSLTGGSGGVANAINNQGTIVGAASNGSSVRAFVSNGTAGGPLVDLGTPLGTTNSFARAYGISQSGVIAGVARNASDTQSEATLWTPDGQGGYTPTTIGSPAGSVFGEAFAATDDGRAVGRYSDPVSSQTRAFYYDGNTSVDLALLSGKSFDNARALDLNDAGQIVGYVADFDNAPSFGGAAVLWEDGEVFDLNTLIPTDSGWELLSAQGINNHGQIVGFGRFGGETRAFLLNVVPEPSSAALLLGVSVIALLRRRK